MEQEQEQAAAEKAPQQDGAVKKPSKEEPAEKSKQEENKNPPEKRRKYIPAILMLFGGAVASITTFLFGYEMNVFLGVTLLSLILFYIGGCLYVFMLDRFDEQIEKARMDEGEVFEKDPETGEVIEGSAEGAEEGTEDNAAEQVR